ncbi:MAG: ATP synthase F1 subunit delta [Dehalococcoidales bacterium]|nr:ATP synthase F1 subunit delta [Dehalococcoidales bacterium]
MAGNLHHAKRYSQAIFQIAVQRKEIERWQDDLKKLAALEKNEDLSAAIDNPRFSFDQKARLIKDQIKELDPLVQNLAYILISRGDFGLMGEIFSVYQHLSYDYRGIAKAEVKTPVPLEGKEREGLASYLQALTGRKIVLVEKVDPAIIGGLIARVCGKIIDGSTVSQLESLRYRLIRAEAGNTVENQ